MFILNLLSRRIVGRSKMMDPLKTWKYLRGSSLKVSRRHRGSYDPDGKTTVQILNHDSELGLMINSYSQVGFRLNNGLMVLGPMAIFPRTVLSWNVASVKDINEESLILFCHLEPRIDILVLGFGDNAARADLNKNIITFMNKRHISVEAVTTEQACATFNFLNAENRYVAGALIPPDEIRVTEDDVMTTQLKHKKLYKSEEDVL